MRVPNNFRIRKGEYGSDESYGNNGAFFIPSKGLTFKIIVSDGMDWEHVSVSLPNRCPTWQEMCTIKDIFWENEETVMQLHPPKSEYVNHHKYTLHLWRPIKQEIPRPKTIMV